MHVILTGCEYVGTTTLGWWCFFRQLLLRAENSQPRLLEIQCTVASGRFRQECCLLRIMFDDSTNSGNPGEIMLSGAAGES